MLMRSIGVGLLVLSLLSSACSDAESTNDDPSPCREAFAAVGTATGMEDLEPVILACPSLVEWTEAAAQHPEALDFVAVPARHRNDPDAAAEAAASVLCARLADTADAPLCLEVNPVGDEDEEGEFQEDMPSEEG
jgi:hypothetical protein